jgi:methyl-accepting chemotaxis protein
MIKIGVKLIASFTVVAVIVAAVAVVGYVNMQSIDDRLGAMYTDELLPIEQLGEANTHIRQLHEHVYAFTVVPDQRSRVEQSISEDAVEVNRQLDLYRKQDLGAEEQTELVKFDRTWRAYQQELAAVMALAKANNQPEALRSIASGDLADRSAALDESMTNLIAIHRKHASQSHDEGDVTFADSTRILIVASVIGLLLALGLGIFISRQIAGSVSTVTRAAQGLAAGDLAQRAVVHSHDEVELLVNAFNTMGEKLQTMVAAEREAKETLQAAIREYVSFAKRVAQGDLTARLVSGNHDELGTLSENLNGMATSLNELSSQVRQGSQGITAAAAEILATVSQHTASANEQSAAVNQTTATVDELRASSEQTARQAGAVAQLAQTSAQVGQDGAQSVEAILRAMTDIRAKVEGIAQDILALSEHTQQIGEIILTVNDIADQSNILALNAAIEAAKAGEQGKGFAVVAAEVRNLAEQSKQATAKVRTILGDIQKATNAAVLATEQGTRGVETGAGLAQRAGEVITRLAGDIRDAAQASQQIAAAAHQQSAAMDQIAQAMREINQATVQFVAGARQSQTAAEGLTTLSRQLQALTERYKLAA